MNVKSAFHQRTRRRPRRRQGVLTLEAILIILVLMIVTFAVFQFGFAVLIKQSVAQAASVAAREAGKGADADELIDVVDTVLRVHNLEIGDNVSLVLEDNVLAMDEQRGNLTCTPPVAALPDDYVRVTVCVAIDVKPFIDPLRLYGVTFKGRTFQISATAKKE